MTIALAATAAGATGQGTAAPVGRSDACGRSAYSVQLRLWQVRGRFIPVTGSGIPAQLLPHDTPMPLSPTLIRVTNAWLVSDGRTLVAVYAGEAGEDAAVGRFAIIRQNLVFGEQTRDIVDVGRVGATTISDAPTGAAVETSAQRADLGFTSASGTKGILRLADDTTQLQP